MRPRRGTTALAGVLPIDKPGGITSHDVVAAIRTATGEGRVGHAGALDPMATGLLVVLLGRATRLEQYLVGHDKCYDARIVFGTTTDTLDADGTVIESAPVPSAVHDPAAAERLLATFIGTYLQTPPGYSAIKVSGVAAHRRARAGESLELAPRPVTITAAGLVAVDACSNAWDVSFTVSKGTYVRSLARDIGRAAGTVAHLAALRRTSVGTLELGRAVTLDAAMERAAAGTLEACFVDPVPLLGLPTVEAPPDGHRDGALVDDPETGRPTGQRVALTTPEGLLGIYVASADALRAETVFVPEVHR